MILMLIVKAAALAGTVAAGVVSPTRLRGCNASEHTW